MTSGCSCEPCWFHAVVVQCTRFTHVTTLLWAFLAGRCHVLLLLAVLHSVMGIIVFSGLLLWFLSLLWACLSCYGILVCHGLSCSCDVIVTCGYSALRWLRYMGVVLFLWNVFSFACIAVVQPITKEVTLPAEFGVGRFEDPRVEVFGKLSTGCVGAGQSHFNSSNLSSCIQVLEDMG